MKTAALFVRVAGFSLLMSYSSLRSRLFSLWAMIDSSRSRSFTHEPDQMARDDMSRSISSLTQYRALWRSTCLGRRMLSTYVSLKFILHMSHMCCVVSQTWGSTKPSNRSRSYVRASSKLLRAKEHALSGRRLGAFFRGLCVPRRVTGRNPKAEMTSSGTSARVLPTTFLPFSAFHCLIPG